MRARHRGFALFVGLICLSLVGLSIAGLMRHFAGETIRSQEDFSRAQLEQMLVAGSMASSGEDSVKLPDELVNRGGSIRIESKLITAQLGKHHRSVPR